jgi:cellulose synthase/poly-beta-1,6-N-acetylglucosamine synthase-like glycosyltransferase
MLSAWLLAALVIAVLATVALFIPSPGQRRPAGRLPWLGRLAAAVIGTALLGAASVVALRLADIATGNVVTAVAVFAAVSLAWLPLTRRWNARAHLAWAGTCYLFVAYLAVMLHWTFTAGLGAAGVVASLLLWFLELFAALLGCAYLWELCDALGSELWRRRVPGGAPSAMAERYAPFVSLHVPAYNEPPDMVIETLRSLKDIDYPAYEIVAIDDNSEDPAAWRPVEAWCRDNGVTFVHLDDWPGYKSGALNYALRERTDPRAELVGVVDSDYQLEPDFLRRCAPLFADPGVGFIQAPQDYRDWRQAPFYRRLYHSYRYFFAVSQPSRNERDGAIFAGTMGLIRRAALEQVGGWDEWCITEDAELSLRLLRAGWSGVHVDRSFGRGVMPLTFEALKGQRFRWCFGGIQILRQHRRSLLPGRVTPDNQLSVGQRWAYLSGALQWYGDLLALVFFMLLLAGAGNIAAGGGLLFRKLTAFLVATIGLMIVIGLVRAVALLRRGTGASWREALGAFLIWQSTTLVVARASVQALYAKQAEFLRTPKTGEESRFRDAIKGNLAESALALFGLAGIAAALSTPSGYAGPLTAALLVWPTVAFAAAPVNSLAAQRAALPPELRARRRTEVLRSARGRRVGAAAGSLAVAGAVAGVVLVLFASGDRQVQPPQLVHADTNSAPSRQPSTPATPPASTNTSSPSGSSTSPSTTPSPTTTSSPASATPPSPTPTPTPTPTAGTTGAAGTTPPGPPVGSSG